MALDRYSPCPGGTGKKRKFCCGDLVRDLDGIHRAMAGNQRQSALDRVHAAIKKHGEKACLLTYKCLLSLSGDEKSGRDTVRDFLQKFPDNPAALAFYSLVIATEAGLHAAMRELQRALYNSQPPETFVLGSIVLEMARMHAAAGRLLPARRLSMLATHFEDAKNDARRLLQELSHTRQIPLLLKQDFVLKQAPEGVAWQPKFDEACALAERGAWAAAADMFVRLQTEAVEEPTIHHNIAVLHSWLGDDEAADAWRRYAELNIDWDDAVEAEAMALAIAPEPSAGWVETLRGCYEIEDLDQLLAALAASPRAVAADSDGDLPEEEQPPPRAVYALLSRPTPESTAGLTIDEMATVWGQARVYGRQTDRPPRIEIIASEGNDFDSAVALVGELAGTKLEAAEEPEKLGRRERSHVMFRPNWIPPEDMGIDQLDELRDQFATAQLDAWLDLPQQWLNGRSPREAAGRPEHRRALAALLLELDQQLESANRAVDLRAIYEQLDVPVPGPIPTEGLHIVQVPLPRLDRVVVDQLSDEQLVQLHTVATAYRIRRVLRDTIAESLKRPGMVPEERRGEVSLTRAALARGTDERLDWIEQARTADREAGRSTANADLMELETRAASGENEKFMELLEKIQAEHGREPGVAEALLQLLSRLGLLRDPAPSAAPPPGVEGETPMAADDAAAAGGNEIWTPDAERAAAGKSKLWVPGQD